MVGFGQIARGNVAGGVQQIVRNLDKVSPAAMAAAKSIGAIGLGLGVGWNLGKLIDDATGLSDIISGWFVKPDSRTSQEWREYFAMRERREDRQSAARVSNEMLEAARRRLQGEAKLEDEYLRDIEALRHRHNAAKGEKEREALSQLIAQRHAHYNEDINALRNAEEEKTKAAEDAARARAELENARYEESLARERARNRDMAIAMKEGAERITAQYKADMNDLNDQLVDANDEQRKILEERAKLIRAAAEKRLQEQLERDASQDTEHRVTHGQVSAPHQMAAHGAMLGGERNILNMEDKKMRLMEQQRAALVDIRAYSNSTAEAVRGLLDQQSGVR
jgi:hypothetical protein